VSEDHKSQFAPDANSFSNLDVELESKTTEKRQSIKDGKGSHGMKEQKDKKKW